MRRSGAVAQERATPEALDERWFLILFILLCTDVLGTAFGMEYGTCSLGILTVSVIAPV